MRVAGIIPESELRQPKSLTPGDNSGLFVAKYSLTSLFTTGAANRVKSLARLPYAMTYSSLRSGVLLGMGLRPSEPLSRVLAILDHAYSIFRVGLAAC